MSDLFKIIRHIFWSSDLKTFYRNNLIELSDDFFKMSDNLLKIIRHIVWWSKRTFREYCRNCSNCIMQCIPQFQDHSEVIGIHCLMHCLELAYRDALKTVGNRLYDRAVTLLLGNYYAFCKRSHKQRRVLRRAIEATKVPNRMPTRVGGSRCMGHMLRAINTFFTTYPAVTAALQDLSHTNADGETHTGLDAVDRAAGEGVIPWYAGRFPLQLRRMAMKRYGFAFHNFSCGRAKETWDAWLKL